MLPPNRNDTILDRTFELMGRFQHHLNTIFRRFIRIVSGPFQIYTAFILLEKWKINLRFWTDFFKIHISEKWMTFLKRLDRSHFGSRFSKKNLKLWIVNGESKHWSNYKKLPVTFKKRSWMCLHICLKYANFNFIFILLIIYILLKYIGFERFRANWFQNYFHILSKLLYGWDIFWIFQICADFNYFYLFYSHHIFFKYLGFERFRIYSFRWYYTISSKYFRCGEIFFWSSKF